jgi:hypothetical protein
MLMRTALLSKTAEQAGRLWSKVVHDLSGAILQRREIAEQMVNFMNYKFSLH